MTLAHPDHGLKSWNTTKKTKKKTELPLSPLSDESTETEALERPEGELTIVS